MKKITKTVYVLIGNEKEIEYYTEEEAKETLIFINEVFNNELEFFIEKRQKDVFEIEKGDKVHWINNGKIIKDRVDEVVKIIKDNWGDIRYCTRQINGDKKGVAYKEDLCLMTDLK